jgi:nitrate reductase alpha subunit
MGILSTSQTSFGAAIRYFEPMDHENPLTGYPNRGWEKIYRNIFASDSSFVFLCAPNDTHNCMLKAYVKNGIITRIGPTYGYGKAGDLYGNKASARWDPRICQKGLAMGRKIYGDRRVKSPMVRRGFKNWVEAGFPRDAEGRPDPKYFQRGKDKWLRINWDEAYDFSARAMANISATYSGKQGAERLKAQGYDPAMIEVMKDAGTQTLKFRGGMAFCGATRLYGMYRFANSLALLDAKNRNVGPDEAIGARGWDSYSWHTDLPPGHPMVTGMQTNDFELFSVENANLVIAWGMNWITTKMPDSHWLTEARLKGVKVASVTVEYSATASKSDEVIVIRPGTDPAFALGLAQYIIGERLYDREFIETNSDLPLLVRMDTLQPLYPHEVFENYAAPEIKSIEFVEDPSKIDNSSQARQYAPSSWKDQFKGAVIFDRKTKRLVAVTRDDFGQAFKDLGVSPDLDADASVTLASGEKVKVRTVFSLIKEYLDNNFTPEQTAKVTNAPVSAIVSLAKEIAKNPEKVLIACGMGPNQFFNSDLKDRAILLVAALTRNIGFPGGNVGSYSGNYKSAIFGGLPYYIAEDPFHPQLKKDGKIKKRKYSTYESLHYYNYSDRPLRVGDTLFTGDSHLPAPTKSMWLSNSNSVIANVKWHYDVVNNTLPKIEFIAFSDWWWTASCEYADIVFAADSWAEFKHPDMVASGSNPFVQVFPRTPLPRIFNTKPDIEIIAGVAKKLASIIDDKRMADMWEFVAKNDVSEYLQRIIEHSSTLKGYKIEILEKLAKEGTPALIHTRTYPRVSSYEQVASEQPWYTKTGRLEFYRSEQTFIDSGEAIPVHREPIDSTPYEPNVIVAGPHPAIRPKGPKDHGFEEGDLSCEARQVRNVLRSPENLLKTSHPLRAKNFSHIYHTPKYRHGVHTTPVDIDYMAALFGPFGDVYRHDKRMPYVGEGYVDINPEDAKAIGVEDGDYVYIDADPEDRPFRGWQENKESYKVSRLLLRARYYPGTPRGVTRTWHNMSGSTFGSVKGHESNPNGMAKNPETGYQSMYRYGSHQSATRAWLRPTLMTETLMYQASFGQGMGKGFAADIHCPVGAPREAFVKIKKAEPGGLGSNGVWRPAKLGFRPSYESEAMQAYLKGGYMKDKI